MMYGDVFYIEIAKYTSFHLIFIAFVTTSAKTAFSSGLRVHPMVIYLLTFDFRKSVEKNPHAQWVGYDGKRIFDVIVV